MKERCMLEEEWPHGRFFSSWGMEWKAALTLVGLLVGGLQVCLMQSRRGLPLSRGARLMTSAAHWKIALWPPTLYH